MLDWLQNHRRMIVAALCVIAALIALMIALALLSGGKTFINAWYV